MLRLALRTRARAPAPTYFRCASSASGSSSLPKLNLAPEAPAPAQSPNVPKPWSKGQEPKSEAFKNVRFEQTDYALQPDGLSAMGLIDQQPVVHIQGRRAVCDGGESKSQEGWGRWRVGEMMGTGSKRGVSEKMLGADRGGYRGRRLEEGRRGRR